MTEDEHLEKLQSEGEAYLQRSLGRDVDGATRGSVICAAMRYLKAKSKSQARPASASQAVVFSQGTAQQTKGSSFLSALAASLDFDVQVGVLVKVTIESADLRLFPILSKALSLLAKKQTIEGAKDADGNEVPITLHAKKRKAKSQGGGKLAKRKSGKKDDEDDMFNDDLSLNPDAVDEDLDDDEEDTSQLASIDSGAAIQGRTGQAFVDDFVSKLVQIDAEEGSSADRTEDVFLASVAREAPLSATATKAVLMCLLHRMRTVSLFELPAYVYQTLLFASAKGGLSLKKLFLVSIAKLFKEIEDNATSVERATQSMVEEDEDAITSNATTPKQIRQVQGTTLFHIDYALKQDPGLVSELVKLAKSSVETQTEFMTPFGIAVLMAVARSPSFQTEVLGHIRESLVRFEKERTTRKKILFASRATLNDEELLRPSASILEAAKRGCGDGWEFIAEPFFQFANLLLERPVVGEKNLAIKLTRALFCAQPSMRKPIMEQITTRIALRGKSAADAIAVLDILARKAPLEVLELNYFIRQSIELCVHLPTSLAGLLINAIKPLLRSRRDLLDYFFLVLRKALFHRENSNRAVAAYGFLNILAFKTEQKSMSNESALTATPSGMRRRRMSSLPSRVALADADLARIKAASQPLRRAITHPPALRSLLYKEIGSFIGSLSESTERQAACSALKELLRPHFLRFIDAAHAPYILIDLCVDESAGGALHEPLGDLVQCLSVVESLLSSRQSEDTYIVELARKLASVSISDFSISKDVPNDAGETADDGATQEQRAESAAAMANRNRTRVLGNVTEALISATLFASTQRQDPGLIEDVVLPLLAMREKIMDVLRHLGCASASNAIRDLGGDPSIEAGYAHPFGLKRPGKSSANPKKPGKKSKATKESAENGTGNSSSTPNEFKFGAFNVLYSAAHSPTLPLATAMQCLEKMACRGKIPQSDRLASFFSDKEDDQNIADLHSYLLAVAMKHIQNANEHTRRTNQSLLSRSPAESSTVASAICAMSRIAMADFKRLKHMAAPQTSSDRLNSLQIIEACAKSVSAVFDNDFAIFTQLSEAISPDVVGDSDDEEALPALAGLGVLEVLIENLIKDKSFKECMSLLRTYKHFTDCIEAHDRSIEAASSLRERQMKWGAKLLSECTAVDAAIVGSITSLATLYSGNNDDMRVAADIIERLNVVIGSVEATEARSSEERDKNALASALAIQQPTSLAAVDSILDSIDMALNDAEWCLGRMSSLEVAAALAGDNADLEVRGLANAFLQSEKKREKVAAQQTIRAEDAAQTRLAGVIRNLENLAKCAVAKWTLQERLLRAITRAYKLLSIATQAQVKRKGDPRTSFITMLNTSKSLSPILWAYLAFLGNEKGQDVSKKGGKVSKEARIVPQLIYEVELFEKLLISAQKHTKINLLRGMRRNTARDFRIQEDMLKEPEEEVE